ncbi:MAG: DUF2344 domain-containing protein [Sedimentisphaerales bacterium]|nr:DUF2344 domain-containing protein [Sedimentisphaerales bacterium]
MDTVNSGTTETIGTLVVRFRIRGRLVWLSHLETASLFQRILVRACVPLCYSEGFNPHPRMSLPLPRSVGLASEDELLSVLVSDPEGHSADSLLADLRSQTPADCELFSAELLSERIAFEAIEAEYAIVLESREAMYRARSNADGLARKLHEQEPISLRRQKKDGSSHVRNVAPFIKSIVCCDEQVVARCRISPEGAIRLEELMRLLEVAPTELSGPVVRKRVEWIRK